ncbi:MAG: hypothetical protein WBF71_08605 [Microthrixaceae bacterium]
MDKWIVDEDFDGDDAEPLEEDELEEDLDAEDIDDVDDVEGVIDAEDEVVDKVAVDEDEDEEVPTARRKRPSDVDEDEDEDIDPDDVEADLDAILKDRIAASPDDEDEEDEVVETGVEGDGTERVAAKSAEEFTCTTCFMIVHPRQFGRKGNLICPEGYSPCSSIAIVESRQKNSAKK